MKYFAPHLVVLFEDYNIDRINQKSLFILELKDSDTTEMLISPRINRKNKYLNKYFAINPKSRVYK